MEAIITTKGIKKTSSAVCECKKTGNFEVRINRVPLQKVDDNIMKGKIHEIILLLGEEVFAGLDFNIKIARSSGLTGRIYAVRQAFCRAVLSYYSNNFDEYRRKEIKERLIKFDRFTVVTDTRVKEAKKFGGPGARARYQKSYR